VAQGAYTLRDADGTPQIILIATGSEVHLALSAADALGSEGLRVRVVSMPCWELFDEQPQEYKNSVLLPGVSARLSIEAGVTQGWWKYVGDGGDVIGLDRFGASAPGSVVMDKLGFNVDNVVARAKALLG
jgi:transketolase